MARNQQNPRAHGDQHGQEDSDTRRNPHKSVDSFAHSRWSHEHLSPLTFDLRNRTIANQDYSITNVRSRSFMQLSWFEAKRDFICPRGSKIVLKKVEHLGYMPSSRLLPLVYVWSLIAQLHGEAWPSTSCTNTVEGCYCAIPPCQIHMSWSATALNTTPRYPWCLLYKLCQLNGRFFHDQCMQSMLPSIQEIPMFRAMILAVFASFGPLK
jgi:hypothetical protein